MNVSVDERLHYENVDEDHVGLVAFNALIVKSSRLEIPTYTWSRDVVFTRI